MKNPTPKSSSQPASKSANGSRAGSLDKCIPIKGSSSQPIKGSKLSSAAERERDRFPSSRPATSTSMHMKKRPRSESRSESPPPKRRAPSAEDEDLPGDISSTIWSIFGRKRDRYVGMDVFSDDEDMEADADALEREEMFRLVAYLRVPDLVITDNIPAISHPVRALPRRRTWKPSRRNDDTKKRNAGARRRRNGSLARKRHSVATGLSAFLDIRPSRYGTEQLEWTSDAHGSDFAY